MFIGIDADGLLVEESFQYVVVDSHIRRYGELPDGPTALRIALCEKNKLVGDELIPFDLIRKAGNDIIHLKEKYTRNDLMLLSDGILYICQMIYERRRKIAAMKKIKK